MAECPHLREVGAGFFPRSPGGSGLRIQPASAVAYARPTERSMEWVPERYLRKDLVYSDGSWLFDVCIIIAEKNYTSDQRTPIAYNPTASRVRLERFILLALAFKFLNVTPPPECSYICCER